MTRKASVPILLGALMALLAGCGAQPVPDVVGMNPQEAIDAMHEAGYNTNSHGGIGLEEGSGFVVCRTEPEPGGTTGGKVDIYSRQDCAPKSATAKANVAASKQDSTAQDNTAQATAETNEPEGESPSADAAKEARYIRMLRREVRSNCESSDADSMCAVARKLKYDDTLDPWDGSLAVTAPHNLYSDEAEDVAGIVMGVSFGLDEGGLCKIDVQQPDGRRVAEHESQARACL
jgi:hypothetical protein